MKKHIPRGIFWGIPILLLIGSVIFWRQEVTQPINLDSPITVTADGRALQGSAVVGRATPTASGQELRIQLLNPTRNGSDPWTGIILVTLPDTISQSSALLSPASTNVTAHVTSIQGSDPFLITQTDATHISLTVWDALPDGYPVLIFSAPQNYFSIPLGSQLASTLKGLSLVWWFGLGFLALVAVYSTLQVRSSATPWTATKERTALPGDLTLLELALLRHGQITPADLAAVIFSLAQRGFLQIVDHGDGYAVFLRTAQTEGLLAYEQPLLEVLFPEQGRPATLPEILNELNRDLFSSTVSRLYATVSDNFTRRGYFLAENPRLIHIRTKTAAIFVQLAGLLITFFGYFFLAQTLPGLIVIGLSVYGCGVILYRKGYSIIPLTPLGSELISLCAEFRFYLAREGMIDTQDRGNLFFQYVPEAIVLNCLQEWRERFRYSTSMVLPQWYTEADVNIVSPDRFLEQVSVLIQTISTALARVKDPNVD